MRINGDMNGDISGFHSGFFNESNCPRSYLQYPRCSWNGLDQLSSDLGKSKEHLGSYGGRPGGVSGELRSYELSFPPWKCYIIEGWFMDVYGFVALE